jgi:NAD(P)-dependent dehydrogenase (short-subunit alcohol dehydrogenase family)
MIDKKSGHIVNVSSVAGRMYLLEVVFTVQQNMLLLPLVKD